MLYFLRACPFLCPGKYANFGVFKLYRDKAQERVLEIFFFQLVPVVPVEDMVLFPKLARGFFNVIDVFASEHMTGLSNDGHTQSMCISSQALDQVIPLSSPRRILLVHGVLRSTKICTFVLNWLIKNRLRKDGDVDEIHDTTLGPGDLSSVSSRSNRFNSGSGVDLINSNNTMLDRMAVYKGSKERTGWSIT
ncbi:MAG: hypothetical protein J3Q66DRAFT_420961 [Benniella sp.]|nr:MAG: hypothetical protein J3Q66DRAFT_420961 [Benniella sp.]